MSDTAKKGILVVSFGTSHEDTRAVTIDAIEKEIGAAFTDCKIYRAWTSKMILARIDGASELYTFHRIAIPIMSPGIATMSIMGFIGGWNAYLLPMIILNKNEKFTLPVMMATLRASTDITANQGAIYLAVAISVIPILLVFAFFSKYIISSISAGAVKE